MKHFPGTLVLSKKSLEIFDAGRSLDISFAVKEITEVSVHTPWEMTILKQSIGKAGSFVHLTAARLVHILQRFFCQEKLIMMNLLMMLVIRIVMI